MMESMYFPEGLALSEAFVAIAKKLTWEMSLQALVALLGFLNVHYMTQTPPRQKLACSIGLVSQPIWLYSTWTAGQYGFFLLASYYSFRYAHVLFVWSRKRVKHLQHS